MANRSNINFNSIKVQLELIWFLLVQVPLIYFNSIKVQLEPGTDDGRWTTGSFQFHKGTIRTLYRHW